MDFNNSKPIYVQIYEDICEKILSDHWMIETKIPSVREFASEIGVNPNTVMRTYEKLTLSEILYNKRGIGYFVSKEAKTIIINHYRENFIKEELPVMMKKIKLLGIDMSVLLKEYQS